MNNNIDDNLKYLMIIDSLFNIINVSLYGNNPKKMRAIAIKQNFKIIMYLLYNYRTQVIMWLTS